MKKLNSQSGRSMVEMLGVLAIIGVLSVGGIAGYSLSMRRHRANGIVDLASKYALITYSKCQKEILDYGGDVNGCYDPINNTFKTADLGDEPAGVREVDTPYFSNDTGVDTVLFSFFFDDDKLCQAVGSIVGSGCNEQKAVYFQIKQN